MKRARYHLRAAPNGHRNALFSKPICKLNSTASHHGVSFSTWEESTIANDFETRENNPLARRLASHSEFSEEELQALLSLPLKMIAIDADTDLLVEGERPTQSCVVLSGFLCQLQIVGGR